MSGVPEDLLEIMQCIECAGPLEQRTEPPVLVCTECGVHYPVLEGGIPDMRPEAGYRPGQADQ